MSNICFLLSDESGAGDEDLDEGTSTRVFFDLRDILDHMMEVDGSKIALALASLAMCQPNGGRLNEDGYLGNSGRLPSCTQALSSEARPSFNLD